MANISHQTLIFSEEQEFAQRLSAMGSTAASHDLSFPKIGREEAGDARVMESGLGCARAIRLALGLEALAGLLIYGLWYWLH